MPTPPYAKLLVKVNGGAPTSGAVTVANGDTVQFVYESAAFWDASPPARLEFYAYPSGWAGPGAPWLSRTVNITVGGTTYAFTNYYFDGSVEPPAFVMPAGPTWGKFLVRLFVNGGLINGVADVGLLDETTALEIVDPAVGLHDLARYEAIQFGGAETFVKDHAENLRTIATGIAAAGTLGAAVPQPVGTTGAVGVSTSSSRQDHGHALGETTLRSVANAVTAQVNWNNQRHGSVADPAAAQDVATKMSSEAAATAAAQNETNLRTAAAALITDIAFNARGLVNVASVTAPAAANLVLSAGSGTTQGIAFSVNDNGSAAGAVTFSSPSFGEWARLSYDDGASTLELSTAYQVNRLSAGSLIELTCGTGFVSISANRAYFSLGTNYVATISPAALAGSVNDYAPADFTSCRNVRQDCSAASTITGLAGGDSGREVVIFNISNNVANTLTLSHDSGASAAANRFYLANNADLVIQANGSARVWYDSLSTRWRVSQ